MAEQAPSEGIPPAGDVPEVTEQQGGAGGGDEKAMVLANISVTVFSSDGHYGGQPEYQEFEDVDVNAPVNEVIAQFDDTGLDDEDVHGEDVVRIYISKPGKPGKPLGRGSRELCGSAADPRLCTCTTHGGDRARAERRSRGQNGCGLSGLP